MNELTLIQSDDWHLHLRNGAHMRSVVGDSAARFARAIVMGSRVMRRDRARLRKTSYMDLEDLLDRIEDGGLVVLGTKKDYYLTHPGCDLRHSKMIYQKLVARGPFNRTLRALDNYQVVVQAIRTD